MVEYMVGSKDESLDRPMLRSMILPMLRNLISSHPSLEDFRIGRG
jgi:hypothetical protein